MSDLAFKLFVGAFLQSATGSADSALKDARYADLTWSTTSLITPEMDVTGLTIGASTMTTREKNTVFDLDLYGRVEAGPLAGGDITVNFERVIDQASFFSQTEALTDIEQPQIVLFKLARLKSVGASERVYDVFYTSAAILSSADDVTATAKEVLTSSVTFKRSGTPTVGITQNGQIISWNPTTKIATLS